MYKVNWWAVLVASVVHFLLGAVWFTLLMKPWLAAIGRSEAEMHTLAAQAGIMPYVVAFVCNVVLARVLAQIVIATGKPSALYGARIAFYMWGGFVATTFLTEYVFEARHVSAFAINAGYPLIGMLIMGAIVGGWTRKPEQMRVVAGAR